MSDFEKKVKKSSEFVTFDRLLEAAKKVGFTISHHTEVVRKEEYSYIWIGRVITPAITREKHYIHPYGDNCSVEVFEHGVEVKFQTCIDTFETRIVPKLGGSWPTFFGRPEYHKRLLEALGCTEEVIPNPEPVAIYPDCDPRDGAPKGQKMFLSRARELARGCPEAESALSDTPPIFWEKSEGCVYEGIGWNSPPFKTREEAEAVPECGYCQCCSEPTAVAVMQYTYLFGKKVCA